MPTNLDLSTLESYSFCDPAAGKKFVEKRSARLSRPAIVTIKVDHLPLPRVFVMQAWAERCTTSKLVNKIFETYEIYHPRRFGIEANALQSFLSDWVREKARLEQKRLPVSAESQPTNVDKFWRIRTILQPIIGHGRLFLHPKLVELKTAMYLIDEWASVVYRAPKRQPMGRRMGEAQRVADYLRRTNMSEGYIQKRLGELGLEGE